MIEKGVFESSYLMHHMRFRLSGYQCGENRMTLSIRES